MKPLRLALVLAFALTAPAAADQGMEAPDFSDRELLADTLIRDESEDRDRVADALEIAQAELAELRELGATPEEIEEQEERIRQLEAELGEIAAEVAATRDRVGELSEAQVVALNRALQNARASDLIVDIDAEQLQAVIAEDFDQRQINALTKAFEAEAIFTRKADRFEAMFDATGKEQFLEQAERAELKAAAEKEKFLSKIERFDALPDETQREAQENAERAAARAARKAASDAARKARDAARRAGSTERRGSGRGLAKGKSR